MAYNQELAHRVEQMMSDLDDVTVRKMFGGLCFMVRGNMACGITGTDDREIGLGIISHHTTVQLPAGLKRAHDGSSAVLANAVKRDAVSDSVRANPTTQRPFCSDNAYRLKSPRPNRGRLLGNLLRYRSRALA